jgi:D-alanyl-D-alanine carboxypeptidase/D-alanyl-D-alanine-endopeptidase (penicillin-binding protein 4)
VSNPLRLLALATVSLCLVALPALAARSAAASTTLTGQIASALRFAGGASGAWVADADAGSQLFASKPYRRRTPASVEKLFTSATALERLGEDARFPTAVLTDGKLAENGRLAGNLYIKGFGDPSLTSAGLARLAAGIVRAGVFSVSGWLKGDDGYFDARRGPPSSGFRISQYVGPLSALAFNDGALPLTSAFRSDHARFVATRLRASLRARGVALMDVARSGPTPANASELANVQSPPLSSLVRHMNQVSDNFYAEILLKGLGARLGGTGTTAAGASVVASYQRGVGVHARVLDGSGLSRADAVSPRGVGRLLVHATRQPWFDSFYRSLPLAGRQGTLKKRMRGTPAAGRCRAKTGTLIAVSALAGYCRSAAGRTIAFAILMNRVNVFRAHVAQDRIAAALASYAG